MLPAAPEIAARIRRLAALAAASLALWTWPAMAASSVVLRADNKHLEEAKNHLAKGALEAALEELKSADGLPGNSNRMAAEIAALRAAALLALPRAPERMAQGDEALVRLFHLDPAGAVLPLGGAAGVDRAEAPRG